MTKIKGCLNFLNLKTYAANFYAQHSRARNTGKVVWVLSFDLLQILISTAFRNSYVISMFQHFLDKLSNQSVSIISIVHLSELIVSVPKTDKCSSDEIKRCTQIRKWPSLFYLYGYFKRRTTCPRGLVVSLSG